MNKPVKKIGTLHILYSVIILFSGTGTTVYCDNDNVLHHDTDVIQYVNKTATPYWPRLNNPVHAVVVFTRFVGEAPEVTTAPSWAERLFDDSNGSVPHFFDTTSFGKYRVTGEYLPKMYEVPYSENYFYYTMDVIKILDDDPDVDFSRFDNDGKDGIPNSGDDDGYVDYLILMPQSRPYGFIMRLATGVMYLGVSGEYKTNNKTKTGDRILIDSYSGCISTASHLNQALGTIIAEISHTFGATDLMDKSYVDPPNDSAGVGFWGLLGRGALGWNERNGPVGPCAYNRMRMGCVGYSNSNLVNLYGMNIGVRMKDVGHPDGKTYSISAGGSEYFLLEFRKNDGSYYYDRTIPKSGLLIWHINEGSTNSTEHVKLSDLECPDGRYLDKGFPLGENPDPLLGGDNLDFWAHDYDYTAKFSGNQGDATDVFDGVTYTAFGTDTNPNTYLNSTKRLSGIEIFNIRREGDEMVSDCFIPPYPEQLPDTTPQIGMGFQLNSGNNIYSGLSRMEKEFYLVNFGLGISSNSLIIVKSDSMYIQPLHFDVPHDAEKTAIDTYIVTDSETPVNVQIARRIVPQSTFNKLLREYNILPETISSGKPVNWVKKLVRQSGTEVFHIRAVELMQNYPNPFNGITTIPYFLPDGGYVCLEVYNILGQRVKYFDSSIREAGYHSFQLDASSLSSGVYLYRLCGNAFSQTRRFTLIK